MRARSSAANRMNNEDPPNELKTSRSRSTTDSGDIVSISTGIGHTLSSSPTSIAAVAPPPSPICNRTRKSGLDGSSDINNSLALSRWKRQQIQQVSKSETLERQLLGLKSSVELPFIADSHNVVVQGRAIVWTGWLCETTGLPTGHGKMFFPDGQVYDGYCRDGLRHGYGHNVWPNHQMFLGEWLDGCRARGTHSWPDGRTCTGSWIDGHLQGRVSYHWPDGASYEGSVVEGRQHGKGTHTWSNGKVFSGDYRNGRQEGEGTVTEPDGITVYEGEFRNGMRNGKGKQMWPTKSYEGEWIENKLSGRGTLTWRHSDKEYSGEFVDGLYHGHGSNREGKSGYIGQWAAGIEEGLGKQYFEDGTVYEGGFSKGKKHGFGCLAKPDGTVYSGKWLGDQRDGEGIEIAGDGELIHCGIWKRDSPDHSLTEQHNALLEKMSDCESSDCSASSAETSIFSRPSEFESIFWG